MRQHAPSLVGQLSDAARRGHGTRPPLVEQLARHRTHNGLGAAGVGLPVAVAAAIYLAIFSGLVVAVAERRALPGECRRRCFLARAGMRRIMRRRQPPLELCVGLSQQRGGGEGALALQLLNRFRSASSLGLRDSLQLIQRALQLVIILREQQMRSSGLSTTEFAGKSRQRHEWRASTSSASSSLTRCSAVSRSRSTRARSSRSAASASWLLAHTAQLHQHGKTCGVQQKRTKSACHSARAPTTARTTSPLASDTPSGALARERCEGESAVAGAACGALLSSAAMRVA